MADEEVKSYGNGYNGCLITQKWTEEIKEAMEQIANTQSSIELMHKDTQHLKTISETLVEMKSGLLAAVLGREIVPVGVTREMLAEQRKTYMKIIYTLCTVFGIIILVLVGLRAYVPHLFTGGA